MFNMNKTMLLIGLSVISIATMAPSIYKWTDEKGQTQFGDKLPAEEKGSILSVEKQSRSLEGQVIDGEYGNFEYKTWDKTIRIRLPHFILPGVKIESRRLSPMKAGLLISNRLGDIYIVLVSANPKSKQSIDDIIQNYQPRFKTLDRRVVNTDRRGKELRIISFREGSSHLTPQNIKDSKLVKKQQLNMMYVSAIFLAGKDDDIFEVVAGSTDWKYSAGITTKKEQIDRAKLVEEHLEQFLIGIEIK